MVISYFTTISKKRTAGDGKQESRRQKAGNRKAGRQGAGARAGRPGNYFPDPFSRGLGKCIDETGFNGSGALWSLFHGTGRLFSVGA